MWQECVTAVGGCHSNSGGCHSLQERHSNSGEPQQQWSVTATVGVSQQKWSVTARGSGLVLPGTQCMVWGRRTVSPVRGAAVSQQCRWRVTAIPMACHSNTWWESRLPMVWNWHSGMYVCVCGWPPLPLGPASATGACHRHWVDQEFMNQEFRTALKPAYCYEPAYEPECLKA